MFMGIDTRPRKMSCSQEEMFEAFQESRSRIHQISSVNETDENEEEEDKQFEEFLDGLDAHQLFKDEDYVKLMWGHLRTENPSMLANFEELLLKVSANIKKKEKECSSLENALMNRKQQQDEQVQQLYEEMENQLVQEKERALNEERKRQDRLRSELASELSNKDYILQELMCQHSQLEQRFNQINGQDSDIKLKNAKLEKERDILEKRLSETERVVEKMQSYMENLRQQSLDEKRARAQSALQATEVMALEKEQIIKQLEMLRTVNKQLLDQKDEINSLLCHREEISLMDAEEKRSDYFSIDVNDGISLVSNATATSLSGLGENRAGFFRSRRGSRISDYLGAPSSERGSLTGSAILNKQVKSHAERKDMTDHFLKLDVEGGIDEKVLWAVHETTPSISTASLALKDSRKNSLHMLKRAQEPSITDCNARQARTLVHPERLFKVVIVGDSAVGKSSLINRFCRGHFVPSFNTTIGVDFQVKSVVVDGRSVALQLWDTAGQEKFRAITQQYFRKVLRYKY
ncbi:ras and EF-hand domain-containing protein-like [Tropilaelaps mercedesae]|uniref:Ras and EF-hand domain-containing protein-like n=1 Tax=Tropilaelaps mercedesae TaxID=418985 RepID=A0A1V9X8V0_9ACAR|nr:ras and EF-hand domain-containing protein-like [Tropilaelaps mercedesae]